MKLFSETQRNGFLPEIDPNLKLAQTSHLNMFLNEFARDFVDTVSKKKVRSYMKVLNSMFKHDLITFESKIPTEAEKDTALLFLTMFTQAYIWENPQKPERVLPMVLSLNLLALCMDADHKLTRPPILNYADYALHNYFRLNKQEELSLENTDVILTFTGTPGEKWFLKIHVMIEKACIPAIQAAHRISGLDPDNYDPVALHSSLNKIRSALTSAIQILRKMPEGCTPECYFEQVRPYCLGWDEVKNPDTPDAKGIIFEGAEFMGKFTYSGPSGAKSSILRAMDALLNPVCVNEQVNKTNMDFIKFAPLSHQKCIDEFASNNVKRLVAGKDLGIWKDEIKNLWINTLKAVSLFRETHMRLYEKYIPRFVTYGTGSTAAVHFLEGLQKQTLANIEEVEALFEKPDAMPAAKL